MSYSADEPFLQRMKLFDSYESRRANSTFLIVKNELSLLHGKKHIQISDSAIDDFRYFYSTFFLIKSTL